MSDQLCPNCGPITEDDGLLFDDRAAPPYCTYCGSEEEEMTPLDVAYRELEGRCEKAETMLVAEKAHRAELEAELHRFYRADGSYVDCESIEEAKGKRLEAAKKIENLENDLAIAKQQLEVIPKLVFGEAVPDFSESAVQACYDSLYNADGEDPYPEEHKRLIRAHWEIMWNAMIALPTPAEPNEGSDT